MYLYITQCLLFVCDIRYHGSQYIIICKVILANVFTQLILIHMKPHQWNLVPQIVESVRQMQMQENIIEHIVGKIYQIYRLGEIK